MQVFAHIFFTYPHTLTPILPNNQLIISKKKKR